MILIPVSVLDVVAREYATLTATLVLAATNLGSGNITFMDGTYPTKVSPLTLEGTCMMVVSAAAAPVPNSINHEYVVSAAATGVCHAHVIPAI